MLYKKGILTLIHYDRRADIEIPGDEHTVPSPEAHASVYITDPLVSVIDAPVYITDPLVSVIVITLICLLGADSLIINQILALISLCFVCHVFRRIFIIIVFILFYIFLDLRDYPYD